MMKINTENLLPLGSVVTLAAGEQRLMIVGRCQSASKDTSKIYDFCAVAWPYGLIGPDQFYLFRQKDIDQIWFLGMQDEHEFEFVEFLESERKRLGLLEPKE